MVDSKQTCVLLCLFFRHDSPSFDDQCIAPSSISMTSARAYLKEYAGYTDEEIDSMSKTFPPLLDLDVKRHLRPKLRFIKYTLQGISMTRDATGPRSLSNHAKSLPPQYYGSRMEKVIAPRHAFLTYLGLPHGKVLLENNAELFRDFLVSCRRTKSFCALCNQWKQTYGTNYREDYDFMEASNNENAKVDFIINAKHVETFDSIFQRGLMAAARNELDFKNQNLQEMNLSSGRLIYLLIKHGANPLEKDVRDISLLHWAAGSGQIDALEQVIRVFPGGIEEAVKVRADRDGASILHWAAAGAKSKSFGCGGHVDVCKFLIESCGGPSFEREIINGLTKDGNSVLMWAAWSGTLDVVKLLVRHRADAQVKNRNGCSVAHWAASGGNLEVCKYLHQNLNIDFTVENNAGNTPLSHAVAYGRYDVVQWLKDELLVEDEDCRAQDLAMDLFAWDTIDDGDQRKKVINLFSDWNDDHIVSEDQIL
jgi:FOG: Ankyrin repeat